MTRRKPGPSRTALFSALILAPLLAPAAARSEWTQDAQLCAAIYGDSLRAIAHCTAAIESGLLTTDELVQTFQNRSFEYLNLGDVYNALIDASTAIGLAPEFPGAWNQRGRVHFESGSWELAIADYEEALRLFEEHGGRTRVTVGTEVPISTAFNLGLAYEALGNAAKASEYLAQAYVLAPDEPAFQSKFREYGLR